MIPGIQNLNQDFNQKCSSLTHHTHRGPPPVHSSPPSPSGSPSPEWYPYLTLGVATAEYQWSWVTDNLWAMASSSPVVSEHPPRWHRVPLSSPPAPWAPKRFKEVPTGKASAQYRKCPCDHHGKFPWGWASRYAFPGSSWLGCLY